MVVRLNSGVDETDLIYLGCSQDYDAQPRTCVETKRIKDAEMLLHSKKDFHCIWIKKYYFGTVSAALGMLE